MRGLSLRLVADLKEARERLKQGPTNSSRPPSSRAPWDRGETVVEPDEAEACSAVAAEPAEATATTGQSAAVDTAAPLAAVKAARKAGKQPGARGWAGPRSSRRRRRSPTIPMFGPAVGRELVEAVGAVA